MRKATAEEEKRWDEVLGMLTTAEIIGVATSEDGHGNDAIWLYFDPVGAVVIAAE
jgi:hypothetical protein